MTDMSLAKPAAPSDTGPAVIRREDYRPPAWLVGEVALDFDLGLERTRVISTLSVRRSPKWRWTSTSGWNARG